jgi:hypothetical protein
MKTCSKCNETKNFCEFHKLKTSKDGYRSQCKKCRVLLTKEYREKNKEILIEKVKIYQENNREKLLITRKKWVDENRESLNKKARVYKKEYYKKNIEDMRFKQQKYRDLNSEKIKKWNKEYYIKVKHIKAWRRLLSNTLKFFNNKKEGYTIDLLGYSAEELKEHIESLFTEGMTWDNYGEWHIDHIKPLSSFEKTSKPSEVNALSNLQPLWATTRELNGVIYLGNLNKWVN